ncbi:MAG: NAD(P)-binding domain-containing protein [Candidatus Promineifilaceae bacterium]
MNDGQPISPQQKKRIAIIGGGWSGIYALKAARADGHEAELFEKDSAVGGIWRYNENKPGGVWRSVYAVTSKTYLHASDFPMPDDYPLFPHHTQLLAYIESYVEHFQLSPYIHLNHKVEKVVKENDAWLLTIDRTDGRQTLSFDALILCIGQAQVPAYPTEEFYHHFTGPTIHSYHYKHPVEEMQGKNILVVGGGESATDIANELSRVANQVYLSIRHGQWFMDRHTGARTPLDTRFDRRGRYLIGDYGGNFVGMAIFNVITGLVFGRGGHGINEWQPETSVMRGMVNKSRSVLQQVVNGRVIPRKGVTVIDGSEVCFQDCEEPTHIDMIVFATGFHPLYPFLPHANPNEAYKYVFDPTDPTLAYVGTARPVFGSIPALAELQARWVSAVFAGQCQLPSSAEMQQAIEKDHRRHRKLFPAHHYRLPNLVSHFEYSDFILKQLGARPNYLKIFFTDHKRWRVLMAVPWTAFETLLTDPEQGQLAYNNIYKMYTSKQGVKRYSLFKFILVLLTLGFLPIAAVIILFIIIL